MPLHRLSKSVGWFVCGLLAATITLAACRSACAGDIDGDAPPELLILDTGDQLRGYSRGVEHGELLWQPDEGLPVRIPVGLIDRIDVRPSGESTEDLPPSPGADAESPDNVIVGPDAGGEEPPWVEEMPLISLVPRTYNYLIGSANVWTQRINFGGQFIDGNAQTDLVNVMVNFENGTPREMRQIDLVGNWGRNQNRQTANKWVLNGNFDWPLDLENKWISFFTSKNEYDAPANLDYRGTLSTGIGYRYFNEPKRRLITRVGPAYTIELFREPKDHRESPDLFAEVEIRWGLLKRTSIEQRMRVQPSILNIELVRVFSTTGLMLDLDEEDRWKLRLGMQYTYNSQPNPGREPSDYTSTVSLVYTRK